MHQVKSVRQGKMNAVQFHIYVEPKKKDRTNEQITQTETELQIQRTNKWLPEEKG